MSFNADVRSRDNNDSPVFETAVVWQSRGDSWLSVGEPRGATEQL
ncbi:hypothetical protein [Baaleninema simplex]|nr:hypothetical protein [Baaleninema simplex]